MKDRSLEDGESTPLDAEKTRAIPNNVKITPNSHGGFFGITFGMVSGHTLCIKCSLNIGISCASMKDPSYKTNQELIKQRWPEIYTLLDSVDCSNYQVVEQEGTEKTLVVNGIQLSSCFGRKEEARLQASLVPPNAQKAWVYGIASGDLQNELLDRDGLQELNVVVLSVGLLKICLEYFDHTRWLSDQRVNVILAKDIEDIRVPFCVPPPCLKLADYSASRLRDFIVLELDTEFINSELRNNSTFMGQIQDNEDFLVKDGDVKDLFGTKNGGRIFVAAAGPSLPTHFEQLKLREREDMLIAVDGAVKPLIEHGIAPDIVVAVDGVRYYMLTNICVDMSLCREIPMVYFPVVHRDVLSEWTGPRFAAYSNSSVYEEMRHKHPKGVLFSAGTVLHAAVDLAVNMGAAQIVLVGADLSFPNDQTHVSKIIHYEFAENDATSEWVLDGFGNPVKTSKNMRGYLRDLERYISRHPRVEFFNVGRSGAYIEGAKYLD